MTDLRLWVGLDLGSYRSSICVLNAVGEVQREALAETTLEAIQSVLSDFPKEAISLIGVEAGSGHNLVRKLRAAQYPVAIFEARAASKILALNRNKTDRNDAKGLAEIARLARDAVPRVHLKGVECQRLRAQLALRQQLVRQRVAIEGALRSMFEQHGGKFGSIRSDIGFRTAVSRELERVESEENLDLSVDVEPLAALGEATRHYLTSLNAKFRTLASEHPVCSNFITIPGVGPICALSFYSLIEDPHRFGSAADVGAYLGLTPRIHSSGTMSKRCGISRMGNRMTRSHLVMAARVILGLSHQETALRSWGRTLVARIGHRRAQVAVARKLAILMLSMWRSGQPFSSSPAPAPESSCGSMR
ncbi:IS110 family RNA-guided transposase [Sphingomonas psychrotolerans]|uniref:IS110 family transposase n=1 Tax=Sphingomonas psychrotolerans TaxID=1327635 RepID=A0A2K8MJ11_9SPHN|nr:IS110 family transposase [Sphingomonas psychrotolerans]ATY32984.1 IS110 family transposase [Sphingomonas psychrotolerans]